MRSEGFSFYIWGSGGGDVFAWPCFWCPQPFAHGNRGRKVTCPWEKPQKCVFLDVSEDVLLLFCVAGVALCDLWRVSGGMCVCTTVVRLMLPCLQEKTQKTYLSRRVRTCAYVVLRGRRSTLWHSMCFRRNVCARPSWDFSCCVHGESHKKRIFLDVSEAVVMSFCLAIWHFTLHCPLYTLNSHFTLDTPYSTLHILHSTLYTLHSTFHNLHSTLDTPHSPLFTLNSLHSTLYTPDFTLQTLHSRLYTPHFPLHTLHSTLNTPHWTLHTLHSPLYTPHSTLHTLHSRLYTHTHTPRSTLSTVHSTLYTLHSLHSTLDTSHTLYTSQSTLHTLHSLHSTLYTPHFTFHSLHSTLYTPLRFTLHTLPATLHIYNWFC